MWNISVPISFKVDGHKKPFSVNLNIYRNAYFRLLNDAKVRFKEIVTPSFRNIPKQDHIRLTYTLYPQSKRKVDTANVCCIVDKFFSDALVEAKVITDDNHTVVLSVLYRYGNVDPTNPRCEVLIETAHPDDGEDNMKLKSQRKVDQMQIVLNESEITAALTEYARDRGILQDGQTLDIDLKATRGDEGYTAIMGVVGASGTRLTRDETRAQLKGARMDVEGEDAPEAAPTAQSDTVNPSTGQVFQSVSDEPARQPAASGTAVTETAVAQEAPVADAPESVFADAPAESRTTSEEAVTTAEDTGTATPVNQPIVSAEPASSTALPGTVENLNQAQEAVATEQGLKVPADAIDAPAQDAQAVQAEAGAAPAPRGSLFATLNKQ